MTYTIISARYANSEHTAAVLITEEVAAVAISATDTPVEWAAMLAWGMPDEYVEPPQPRRMIRKSLVKQRLIDLGLMEAAFVALTANPVAFARWFDMDYPEVYADDPDALGLLNAIGAPVDEIMAP